jgi:hypothetical protein
MQNLYIETGGTLDIKGLKALFVSANIVRAKKKRSFISLPVLFADCYSVKTSAVTNVHIKIEKKKNTSNCNI